MDDKKVTRLRPVPKDGEPPIPPQTPFDDLAGLLAQLGDLAGRAELIRLALVGGLHDIVSLKIDHEMIDETMSPVTSAALDLAVDTTALFERAKAVAIRLRETSA